MKAYIIDNGSFYTEQLRRLLGSYEIVVLPFDGLEPSDIEQGSLVVLSGGHVLKVQWHDKQYAKEIDIIKHHDGPIIGICLGAQLIAHSYGEHLHTLQENRKGTIKVAATDRNNPLFDGLKELKVYENHHLSLRKLHRPLVGLAESEDGVEIYRHESKPVYGVQFHPEVFNDNDGQQIFEAILNDLTDRR